jgi:hypothetical protein
VAIEFKNGKVPRDPILSKRPRDDGQNSKTKIINAFAAIMRIQKPDFIFG